MPAVDASELLRPGLLDGVSVLLAGASPHPASNHSESLSGSLARALSGLGARIVSVGEITGTSEAEEGVVKEMVGAALSELGSIDLLVVDGTALLARGASVRQGGDGHDARGQSARDHARSGLRNKCLHGAWNVTRATFEVAFAPDRHGGRILYLAPPPGSGEHALAAAAGLENLARTLSIEWARHAVTAITIARGAGTSDGELAALSAYVASPAGAYFSGCLLDLRGVGS